MLDAGCEKKIDADAIFCTPEVMQMLDDKCEKIGDAQSLQHPASGIQHLFGL